MDQSALTGESLPVTICAGEPAMMGGTIVRGEVCRLPVIWAGEYGRVWLDIVCCWNHAVRKPYITRLTMWIWKSRRPYPLLPVT